MNPLILSILLRFSKASDQFLLVLLAIIACVGIFEVVVFIMLWWNNRKR